MDIFRTLIVDDANVALAREIAASFGPGGVGMWTTPLSSDGNEPASHYISSGYVPAEFAYMVPSQEWTQDEDGEWTLVLSEPGDPIAVYTHASENGVECTQDDVDALFVAADVTAQESFVAMARLGLQIVNPPDEIAP
jgi:hypothetical protein